MKEIEDVPILTHPREDMKWFEEARYGMYIHFGLASYKSRDLSWGMADGVAPDRSTGAYPREEWTSWPQLLRLEKFSKEELADILRHSGMKYVMLVAKHHDGFHFYDTQCSEFKVTHTPYGKDFVREVIEACHLAGVKVGVYFSQRDWYHPDYAPIDTTAITVIDDAPYYKVKEGETLRPGKTHRKYIDYMFRTVRELCTNYGKLDMFNFDAVYWNGMFTADMWDAERLTRMIRELQPGIIINNRAGLPGDYDSPEQRIGMFQDHRMWETCMCLCDTWSYSPTRVKDGAEVFRHLQSAAVGNGNLLLSWGMKWSGEWDATQKQSLFQAGEWLARYGESIYGTHGGPWLPQQWGGSTFHGDKVYVHLFQTGDAPVELPRLQGVSLQLDQVLTGQQVRFTEKGAVYVLSSVGEVAAGQPFIVRLKASRALTAEDVLRVQPVKGLFADESTYGKCLRVAEGTVTGTMAIDLGKPCLLKGVQVQGDRLPGVRLTVALAGQDGVWYDYKTLQLDAAVTEVPVATYVAGILKEGVPVQQVRLVFDTADRLPVKCRLFGTVE